MSKIRCAVIGVGYLGRFHAQKYQLLPEADLVGVCDSNIENAHRVGQELNVATYTNHQELLDKVDAVSIATTTQTHYEIAKAFLARGIHVLVEKPITETVVQAQELIQLAHQHQAKFQVGHLERFNSVRLALDEYLINPQFIEAERLAPFNPRGADVNVVLDLMIHDIDLILNMVKSPVTGIQAHGTPVLTKDIDIAHVRLQFANHCIANLTASRVNQSASRKTRIIQGDSYLSLDYQNKELSLFKKGPGEMFPGIPEIVHESKVFEQGDALLAEIKSFLHSIANQSVPLVPGEDGLVALETAEHITSLINKHLLERYA
ncbi:MAG: UDP-N-acetyl-D-glucosamine dehydrogenase [Legionella sp. 40-6]|nr:Gfo/Idh/MocA family oxidoreductase [Legionella sp.]OJX97257.1 MAG: UDP-N-acetyl-D-glucosamine dehydrogenase [Legionella sp. 40-6]